MKKRHFVITSFQLKRGKAADLKERNPRLLEAEPCFEIDTGRVKFGRDGKHWNDLSYSNSGSDHEELSNIKGGNDEGHYHLTREQYEKILEIIGEEAFPPVIERGQKLYLTVGVEMTPYSIQGINLK